MARTTGTVKWFNDAKGYGFITPENLCHVPGRDARAPTIAEWVAELNGWGAARLIDCIARSETRALPLIEYQEPPVEPDGSWSKDRCNAASVIHGRPFVKDAASGAIVPHMDHALMRRLAALGVRRTVCGHSPVGPIALVLRAPVDGVCSPRPRSVGRKLMPSVPFAASLVPSNSQIVGKKS